MGRRVKITQEELYQLKTQPAAFKRTGVGALLRDAWKGTLGEIQDDVDIVQARVYVSMSGWGLSTSTGHYLGDKTADLALGRKKTHLEWANDLLGRSKPLVELDEARARALRDGLYQANTNGDWARITATRAKRFDDLASLDKALFHRSGITTRITDRIR